MHHTAIRCIGSEAVCAGRQDYALHLKYVFSLNCFSGMIFCLYSLQILKFNRKLSNFDSRLESAQGLHLPRNILATSSSRKHMKKKKFSTHTDAGTRIPTHIHPHRTGLQLKAWHQRLRLNEVLMSRLSRRTYIPDRTGSLSLEKSPRTLPVPFRA